MDTIALQSVRWRAVGLFVAVAMGAAFALDAVCALTGGLAIRTHPAEHHTKKKKT